MAASIEMDVSSEFHERSYDDPFLHDSLFKKIYDRMDPNDPDRVIYEIGFDFSEKKNHCWAMEIGKFMVCGKTCEDVFCDEHMFQIKVGLIPGPCKCCGVGVLASTYCRECIIGTRQRRQGRLLAKEFEEPHV